MTELIRPATLRDASAIRDIYAPFVESTAITFQTRIPTVEAYQTAITEAQRIHAWLVVERDRAIVGYANGARLKPYPAYDWSVELTIYVAETARRTGAGRRLLTALIQELRDKGYVNAFAAITLPNDASVGLFESLAFTRVGIQKKVGYKLGTWHDVGLWQRAIAEHPDEPTTVPATEVADN